MPAELHSWQALGDRISFMPMEQAKFKQVDTIILGKVLNIK